MSDFDGYERDLLLVIADDVAHIRQNLDRLWRLQIMTKADLDAALQTAGISLTKLTTDVTTLAANASPDLSSEVATVKTFTAALGSLDTQAQAAVPTVPPPATTPPAPVTTAPGSTTAQPAPGSSQAAAATAPTA